MSSTISEEDTVEVQSKHVIPGPILLLGAPGVGITFIFGGTSLLIVVGVAMDTVNQIESQLIMRHYDGFMKKTRIRGRRG